MQTHSWEKYESFPLRINAELFSIYKMLNKQFYTFYFLDNYAVESLPES